MPKLVILNQGLTGQSHELKAEHTTIGRVEDNMFQISEPSVSSHHCEVVLRGKEVVIKGSQLDQRDVHQQSEDCRERFAARPETALGQRGIVARHRRGWASASTRRSHHTGGAAAVTA